MWYGSSHSLQREKLAVTLWMNLNIVKYAAQDICLEISIHQVQNATYAAQRGTNWMVLTFAYVEKMDAGQVTARAFVSTVASSSYS